MQTTTFDKIKSSEALHFEAMEIRAFPSVSHKMSFGSSVLDTRLFLKGVWEVFESQGLENIQKIKGYHGQINEKSVLRIFVFFGDREVLAAELSGPKTLGEWCQEIANEFREEFFELEKYSNSDTLGRAGKSNWDELEERAKDFALKFAPSNFDPAKQKKEKERDDKKKAKIFGNYKTVVLAEEVDLDALKTNIRMLLESSGSQPSVASSKEIQSLENRLDVPLPQEMKALYEMINGAKGFFFGYDLLSIEAVAHEWERWNSTFNELSSDDLKCVTGQRGVVYAAYCCPRWIPFVDLVGGNFLAFDLAPDKKGRVGQIIEFGADVDCTRRVALDLGGLLEACCRRVQGSSDLSTVFPVS